MTAVLFAIAGVFATVCLFLICLWVRLLFGPVYLGPSVGMVSGALADALPEGISLGYGQAALEFSREDDRVHLVVLDIRMADRAGKSFLSAPKAEVDLAGAPLLKGEAEVHRITLVGVKLTLVRTKEGKLRFGIGKNRIKQDIVDQFVHKLATAKGGSSLKALAVHRAKLAFYDEASDLYVSSDKADLHLTRRSKGGNLQTALNAEIAVAGRPASVHIAADFPLDQAQSKGTLVVKGLDLAAFAIHPKGGMLARQSHLPSDVHANFTLSHGKLRDLKISLAGQGKVQVPALKQSLQIAKLTLSGHYDGRSRALVFSDGRISSNGIRGVFSGTLTRRPGTVLPLPGSVAAADVAASEKKPGQKPDAAADEKRQSVPQVYEAKLELKGLTLDLPHLFAGPVHFASVSLQAGWDDAARRLDLTRLHIGGTPFTMEASGAIQFVHGESPAVDVTGSVGTLNVRDFARYWPLFAAPGGRSWVDKNMPSGEVGPFSFAVHLKPGDYDKPALPSEDVDVRFLLENVEASYIAGMPHLTGIYGRGHLTGTDFTIDVDRASDGPLAMTAGQFHIPDINADSSVGDISFTLAGRMQDLMTLLNSPPLGYPRRFGISPNATGGMVTTSAQLSVPLIRDVPVSEIDIAVQADTENFAIALEPTLKITGGTIHFDVNNDRLQASGTAGLGGSESKLKLDWSEAFHADKVPLTTQLTFSGPLDETARDSLGVIPAGYIRGMTQVKGHFEGRRGAMTDGSVALSLTPADVSVRELNILKEKGAPLSADIRLGFAAKSTLSQIEIALGGGKIGGHAVLGFTSGGQLQRVELTDFHDGGHNRFAFDMLRSAGADKVTLRGAGMDLSRLFDTQADGKTPAGPAATSAGPDKPLYLEAHLDTLVLRDQAEISGLSLKYRGTGKRIADLALDGKLGKAKLHGGLKTGKTGRELTLESGDAGLLFRGLLGFDSMRGGRLLAKVQLPGTADSPPAKSGPDYTGTLEMHDFRIVHQPVLARLFTAGSLGGMLNLMRGNGIVVDRFHTRFSARHQVISILDTQAAGPSVGATAEGYIDLGKYVVALKGALVPLFGINSVLGNIPILGQVLTSKKGEGIFGFSYAISGAADAPKVSINPLSVLAPGFLRRIFEGEMPNASEAPSNQQKSGAKPPSGMVKTGKTPVPDKKMPSSKTDSGAPKTP